MKKIILFAIFLICACVVKAQNPTGVPQLFNGKWYKFSQFVEVDSALLVSNKDTNWLPRQPSLVFWQHASVDTAFWVYNGKRWNKIGSYIDTTYWNNKINKKQDSITLTTTGTSGVSSLIGSTLNIPNYSGSLTGYVPYTGATNNVDLGSKNLTGTLLKVNSGINLKNSGIPSLAYEIGYTGITAFADNFTFYNFYGNKGADFYYAGSGAGIKRYDLPIRSGTLALVEDTVNLSNRINLKADKSTTLTINGVGYDLSANRSWTVSGTDTTSLSDRINLKLNISDTASMLSGYQTAINARVKYTDTASMLLNYQNAINDRVKYTDTASMLAPYLRKADTASLSNRINKKQDSLILTTTGTSGASTLVGSTLNIPQYQGIITNPITGTGTPNTVPKFTGTGSSIGDSHIKDDGNVVTVNATAGSFGALQVGNYNGNILMNTNSSTAALIFQNTTSGNKLWDLSTPGNDLAIDEANIPLAPPRMYFKAGGHVLINSSTDDAAGGQLQVTGSIQQSVTSSMLKASSTGIISAATVGTDYGTVTSVGLSMPVAFSVANSPITSTGTLAVTAVGTAAQYIRGDGQLATLPSGASGGSSVNYYLNGGTSQGTIGGSTYYEMSKDAVIGTNADFNRTNAQGNGLIAQFITDAGDPNRTEIPAGAWNFELFFNASSNGGSPSYYIELLKYNGTTFTSIASGSAIPELITSGTTIDLYLTSLAVPYTTLSVTDRLVIRVYVVTSGKTITLHTQDGHLCLITTTFAGGVSSLNGLTANTQYLAVGTAGTDFAISSITDTHTFNLPTASATNRGALSSADWSTFNGKMNYSDTTSLSNRINLKLNSSDTASLSNRINLKLNSSDTTSLSNRINTKQNTLTLTTTGTSGASTLTGATLNIPQYQSAGTYVTSVTGTSPIVSSGGTTPAISIPAASGSVNGYLTSTDWTAFNGKQNAINGTGFVKASGTTISYDNSSYYLASNPNGYNTGTVTSVATGLGLTGGTITTSGTLLVDTASASILSRQRAANTYLVPSSLSGYVPYTGATTNVTLGSNNLQSGGDPLSDVNGVLLSNGGTVDTRISSTVANSYNFNASRSANGSGYVLSRNGYHKANIGVIGGGGSNTNDGVMTFGSYYQASSGSGINDGAFTELMRLNPSGVGNATLDVTGSGKFSTGVNMATTSGNVGIGTTSPTHKLDILGLDNTDVVTIGSTTAKFRFQPYASNGESQIFSEPTAGGSYNPLGLIGGVIRLFAYTGLEEVQLWTSNNQRLTINQAGNTLIGTTADNGGGAKLQVSGAATFSSNVGINGGDFRYRPNGDVTNSPALVLKVVTSGILSIASEVIGDANANSNSLSLRVSNVDNGRFDALTIASTGAATFSSSLSLNSASGSSGQGFLFYNYSAGNAGSRSWKVSNDQNNWGDFAIQVSTTQTGSTFTTPLQIASTGAATFSNLAGTGSRAVLADASGVLSAPVSDSSVKENIKPLNYGIADIMKLKPVSFEYIKSYKNFGEGKQIGNIAQDMAKVIPEAVFTTPSTGKMGINYDQLNGVYIKALQELKKEIETLKAEIEKLKK